MSNKNVFEKICEEIFVFLEPNGDKLRQCISGTEKDHINYE